MDNPQEFKSLQDRIQAALISATRTVTQISAEDLRFQRSLDPNLGNSLDTQSARILSLSSSLLKSASSISGLEAPQLEDVEDVDNHWRNVVDVVDSLLEKADSCLDEYTGVRKQLSPPVTEEPLSKRQQHQSLGNKLRTQNLLKPQLAFENKVENHDSTPWKPLLTSKPHAITSLEQSLGTFNDELQHQQYDYNVSLPLFSLVPAGIKPEDFTRSQRCNANKRKRRLEFMGSMRDANGHFRYRHPYESEILEMQFPPAIYEKADPIPYMPVESTKAIFVDTFEGSLAMLAELKKAKEFAVDLEHHDARSYTGLVSLMQISTRDKDWIVDTLKPWRLNLQVLNEVFADPKIIKVFHGAYMDIVWLQRDLGLYVVGLFDTHHASRVLRYPGGSLAYLLKRFVNFDADKKYQMADWRIRPLPEEMFFYARADTHYLLFIHDNLRNELVENSDPSNPDENRIELVLQKSKETALLRFERQIYDEAHGRGPGGWYQLLMKTPGLFTNEQFAVFRAVHAWRDQIARKDDDSTNYVMPNHVIFTLAKLMPMDMASFYGAVHPISHNVKKRTTELLDLIKSAKAAGKDGPSMLEVLRPDSTGATAKSNISSAKSNRAVETDTNATSLVDFAPGPLRSESSLFWGSAFGSSVWEPSSANSLMAKEIRLAVPMPQLDSEDFESKNRSIVHPQEQADQTPAGKMPLSTTRDASEDEAFIIKKGKKRKAEDIDENQGHSENATEQYDISLNDSEDGKGWEKAARRAERKAQKKLEKAAKKLALRQAAESMEVQDQDEEAFDYSKAESVLHGNSKGAEASGSKRKKPFDPYTKSTDAPKGMRRLQTERPGKSFTFKS